jgi:hypothetical protein
VKNLSNGPVTDRVVGVAAARVRVARRFNGAGVPTAMAKGLEVGIHLRPGLADETFVARALGNLAAFELGRARKETLEWQVLLVETSPGQHHYRLVIRHPERVLDLGVHQNLSRILDDLSNETHEELAKRFAEAQSNGLTAVPLRRISEPVDFWRDDFWNWIG